MIVAPASASLYGLPVRTSTLIPEGQVYLVDLPPDAAAPFRAWLVGAPTGRPTVIVNPRSRDRYGSRAPVVRMLRPTAGYTRHTLGARELEREHRLRSRGR